MKYKKVLVLVIFFILSLNLIFSSQNKVFKSYFLYLLDNLFKYGVENDERSAVHLAFILDFLKKNDIKQDELDYFLSSNIYQDEENYEKYLKNTEYLLDRLSILRTFPKIFYRDLTSKQIIHTEYPWDEDTIEKVSLVLSYIFENINKKLKESKKLFFVVMRDVWKYGAQIATAGSSIKGASKMSLLLDFCKENAVSDEDLETWIKEIDKDDEENILKINFLISYLGFCNSQEFLGLADNGGANPLYYPWDDITIARCSYILQYILNYIRKLQKEEGKEYIEEII